VSETPMGALIRSTAKVPISVRTGSGRAVEDDAAGDLAAVLGVGLGLLEKVHHLGELELGPVAAGDVVKGNAGVGDELDLGLGLGEPHGIAGPAHAPDAAPSRQEEEAAQQHSRKNEALDELSNPARLLGGQHGHIDLVLGELRQQVRVVGQGLDGDADAVNVDAQQLRPVAAEGNFFDAVGVHELDEVAVPDRGGGVPVRLDGRHVSFGRGRGRRGRVEGHAKPRRRGRGCGGRVSGVRLVLMGRGKGLDSGLLFPAAGQQGEDGEGTEPHDDQVLLRAFIRQSVGHSVSQRPRGESCGDCGRG
jgi:hypothetical protein